MEPTSEPRPSAIIDQQLDHPPERVWDALTTDVGLAAWMGEGAAIEPVVDGALDLPDPVTGRQRQGTVTRADPGKRLDFTWWPVDEPDAASMVTLELVPAGTGTRLTVVEYAALGSLGSIRCTAAGLHTSTTTTAAWAWRGALLCVAFDSRRAETGA